MKAKFICYHLHNTGEICDKGSSICKKLTKVVKLTGIDNGLCSKYNKSNYQI